MGQLGYTQGDLGWSELNTTNAAAAVDFYSALVGWEKKGEPMPGYHVFGREGEMLGGITNLQPGDTTPRWMPYITVNDLKATLAKAESLGASIILPPMALPQDGGHIAIIKDLQGVATGLAQYKK
ncbi:MAG: VOC family protein [Verrucomicrobia bacterium]|nr:VOC family protein [Verrucomicrobiota bacterium]